MLISRITKSLTIRRWYTLFFLVFVILLGLSFTSISWQTSEAVSEKVRFAASSNLYAVCRQAEDKMHSCSLFLSSVMTRPTEITSLITASPDTQDWFSATYLLKEKFNDAGGLNAGADFFYYQPSDQTLIGSSRVNVQSWRSALTPLIEVQEDGGTKQVHWNLMTVENRVSAPSVCLTRLLSLKGGYLGCSIPVNDLLSNLTSALVDSNYTIANADGKLLRDASDEVIIEDFSRILENDYSIVTLKGVKCMILTMPLADTDLFLVSITQDYPRMVSATLLRAFIIILFLISLLVFLVFYFLSRKMIAQPVSRLLDIMRRVREGDTGERLLENTGCLEFTEIGRSFNETMDELEQLKISIYEKQLSQKEDQIEMLKMQVTPHFLVNCLNSVHQLIEVGRSDLSLKMTQGLTQLLRYLLDSGRSVSLKEELAQTSNYVELSLIRYPGAIDYEEDIDPEMLDAAIVPYLVLEFVENTVKYEVTMGEVTKIRVQARRIQKDGQPDRLMLIMTDSGEGYSEKVLEKLSHLDDLDSSKWFKESHIGIENVYRRVRLLLGNDCSFQFSNDPETGGAQMVVEVPFAPYTGP